MKKIIHIVSNKEWGGGEQFVYDLAQRQLEDGIDITVCCRPVESVINKFREAGISVVPLRLKGVTDLGSAWRLSRLVRKMGASTIHAHNFKDAFTAAYARRLSGRSDVGVVMNRHLTRKGKTSLPYNWLYRNVDAICFDSSISKETFLSKSPKIDPGKLLIVHTSIVAPKEPVVPVDIRQTFNIGEKSVVAMFHGRLDPEKGIDVLFDAVALLRELDFRLVLIGRGSDAYTEHLREKVAMTGIADKVIFAGFRHPVLPYVAAADFGILASTVREGCPLSPQEYMSQGKPVIATDNGGQREYIVSGKNGMLVAPGDSRQLADSMRQLILDASLRRQLGQQAKADYDERLNYEHFYTEIKQIYA